MAIRRKRIQQLISALLKTKRIIAPPVPVEQLVRAHGLEIRKQKNENSDISGFLVVDGDYGIIGVNAVHPLARQRFTVAHELGHFLLHSPAPNEVHVDRAFAVKFRDNISGQGISKEEREANFFAAELLMPQVFIQRDLAHVDEMDVINDEFVKRLSRRYTVSSQAMLFRLANLGYLHL